MAWFRKRSGTSNLDEPSALSDAEADALGFDLLVEQGLSSIRITTSSYMRLFGLDRADWHVDLSKGEITFTTPEHRAVAPVQVIGTIDPHNGTWLWGWDHPSVPEKSAVAAARCHAFGKRNGLPDLTTVEISCSETEAWRFAQLAVRLGTETCAYRGQAGGPIVFTTFGAVTVQGIK